MKGPDMNAWFLEEKIHFKPRCNARPELIARLCEGSATAQAATEPKIRC
jgi:hypothetical protein